MKGLKYWIKSKHGRVNTVISHSISTVEHNPQVILSENARRCVEEEVETWRDTRTGKILHRSARYQYAEWIEPRVVGRKAKVYEHKSGDEVVWVPKEKKWVKVKKVLEK